MFDIQRTYRLHSLCGKWKDGSIKKVPNILCVRKHMEPHHTEYQKFLQYDKSKMFAFVSSPDILEQQQTIMKRIVPWCHPFKKRKKQLRNKNCSYLMLPESDFMDVAFVGKKQPVPIEFDFFYLAVNNKSGIRHKGFNQFIDSLPVMCGEYKLKCLIICYYPAQGNRREFKILDKERRGILSKYEDKITILWGWQKQHKFAKSMLSCKFGFFPNEVDCSPRVIPECILRDRPVLVNENIWGGWHYVNEQTGAFFSHDNLDTLRIGLNVMISNKDFSPSDNFMRNYGFTKSSRRLAEFLSESFDELKGFSHVYFSAYQEMMGMLC